MPQEFNVLQCYKCSTFQVQQVKKAKKWACKMCGEKQSIKKVFGRGSGADCRCHVQRLNTIRGELEVQREFVATKDYGDVDSSGFVDTNDENILTENIEEEGEDFSAGSKWSRYMNADQYEASEPVLHEAVDEGVYYTTDMKDFNCERKHRRGNCKRKRNENGCSESDMLQNEQRFQGFSWMSEETKTFCNRHPSLERFRGSNSSEGTEERFVGRKIYVGQSKSHDSRDSRGNYMTEDKCIKYKSNTHITEKHKQEQSIPKTNQTIIPEKNSKWGKFMDDEDEGDEYDDDEDDDESNDNKSNFSHPSIFYNKDKLISGSYNDEREGIDCTAEENFTMTSLSSRIQTVAKTQSRNIPGYHGYTVSQSGIGSTQLNVLPDMNILWHQKRYNNKLMSTSEDKRLKLNVGPPDGKQKTLREQENLGKVIHRSEACSSVVSNIDNPELYQIGKENKVTANICSDIPSAENVTCVNDTKPLFVIGDLNEEDLSFDM